MNMPQEPYSLIPARVQPTAQHGARIELQDLGFRYGEDQPWLYRHTLLSKTAYDVGPSKGVGYR
jgi:hypothetical protein